MKLVTYIAPAGGRRAGIVAGDRIIDLAGGAAALGHDLAADLLALLEMGEPGLSLARSVAAEAGAGRLPGWPHDQVKRAAARPRTPKLLAAGGNDPAARRCRCGSTAN